MTEMGARDYFIMAQGCLKIWRSGGGGEGHVGFMGCVLSTHCAL